MDIRIYFLLFIIYSFLGWCMEVAYKKYMTKKLGDRGFLIGPVCPIYGMGAILITLILGNFKNNPVLLFVMAILVCGTLEYLTSYIMEKIFHARWWDYSTYKFNINGRVALHTIIPFGLLGLAIIYILNPFFIDKLEMLSDTSINIAVIGFLSLMLVDLIVSVVITIYITRITKEVGEEMDNTDEITEKVREILLGKSILYRRIVIAYPSWKTIKVKVKEKHQKIKKHIKAQKDDIKDNIEKQKKAIKQKVGGRNREQGKK